MENIHNIVMSLQKKGEGGGRVRDRSMAELLRQLPVRGRLGIHVMDSVDSLLQLLLPNPSLRCPATAGLGPIGVVGTGSAQLALLMEGAALALGRELLLAAPLHACEVL